jgi:hypothetical protein
VSTIKIPLNFSDRFRSRPGSATTCVIATAAKRQWGGHWTVTAKSVEHTSGSSRVTRWRPSASALLVMLLFDLGLPVPARSVKLVRGKAAPPRRIRRVRRAAAGATAGGVLLLVVSGLAWVVFAVAGVLIAALAVVTAVKLRGTRQPAVPFRPVPQQPARPAPSFTRPERPQPDPEPVQLAAPKAAPVIKEPAPQEVVNAST